MSVEGVDVRVAEGVGYDFDSDLSRLGGVDGDGFESEGLLGATGYHGVAGDWFTGGGGEIEGRRHG